MKKIFISVFFSLLIISIYSQSCLPEGITFSTQAQIDSFQINYPECTEIEGDVKISGENIYNLNGLKDLTLVGGGIMIHRNHNLISLAGLENLISIAGSLEIGGYWLNGNALLQDLTGLDNLTIIEGSLHIAHNSNLRSLTGLEGLTSIGGSLKFGDCDAKNENADGKYECNSSLINLSGLKNLSSIGGSIIIECNNSLISLTGLEKVTSIGGQLDIRSNGSLSSLSGLENVTSVEYSVVITGNESLSSLSGLDNVEANTIIDLVIGENYSLSICEVKSICDYLAAPGGEVEIRDNAIGCNSVEEVQDSCEAHAGIINEAYIKNNLVVYPNPARQEFNISCDKYTIQEVCIYTLTGQKVLMIRPKGETIDISNLQTGMYIVEVMVEGTKVRQKLLVE